MDVSLEKIPFEHKTIAYGEETICKVLGITVSELNKTVEIRLVNNPAIQLGVKGGG